MFRQKLAQALSNQTSEMAVGCGFCTLEASSLIGYYVADYVGFSSKKNIRP